MATPGASTTNSFVNWQPQQEGLTQFLNLLRSVTNPALQDQIRQQFEVLKTHPDWPRYLLLVLTQAVNEQEYVREAAVLFNDLRLQHELLQLIKEQILTSLGDSKWSTRKTVANIVTTALSKGGGLMSWPNLLPFLYQQLDSTNSNAVEGTLYTLSILCEDWNGEMDKPELGRPAVHIIPKLISFFHSPNDKWRRIALTCVCEFLTTPPEAMTAQMELFLKVSVLWYSSDFQELFQLASDQAPKVRQKVCKALVTLTELHIQVLSPYIKDVIIYMLQSTQDTDPAVALEACEFWSAIAPARSSRDILQQFLATLLPLLIGKMVYTQENLELLQAEDDDSHHPDKAQDIKPKFKNSRGFICYVFSLSYRKSTILDEDEDSADDFDEPQDWNIRKCSAASLDTLSMVFRDALLPVLLPVLQDTFQPNRPWQGLNHSICKRYLLVLESGVLAIGAVSSGCLTGLVPHLPNLFTFLSSLFVHPQPLVRSITCWAMSRYSRWIVSDAMQGSHDRFLKPFMAALLQSIHDQSKRVQASACSAFATLEEEAQTELRPYIRPILENLMRAFRSYHAKNITILYDAIGTLADSVGADLNTPEYCGFILPPLFEKWNALGDQDKSLFPLLECLASVVIALGAGFQEFAPPVFQRALRVLEMTLVAHTTATQEKRDFPDTELIVCSLDLIGGLLESLQSAMLDLVRQSNLVTLAVQCLNFPSFDVRQSSTAVMGDLSKWCFQAISGLVPQVMPLLVTNIVPEYISVCNNASWAIGEIALNYKENIRPFVPGIVPLLINIINRLRLNKILRENVSICLCRIAIVATDLVSPQLNEFMGVWKDVCAFLCSQCLCLSLRGMRDDAEKESAYYGLCCIIAKNPVDVVKHIIYICDAFASTKPRPQMQEQYKQILHYYKNGLGNDWSTLYNQFPEPLRKILFDMYQLT